MLCIKGALANLFAFSIENWKYFEKEVMGLPQFFCYHCNKFSDTNKSDIRLKVIGNLSAPDASFQLLLRSIGTITAENKKSL